ncbi:MAG: ATP-dependent helicase, partial [Nocardioidaceae bacterium]|nr:ATP-dependent helicase [Nocardioidaceae bacterium]
EGAPDDEGALIEIPEGTLGAEVLELRSWAEDQAERSLIADRDAAPSHTDRAWRQISVQARECLGAAKCPYGAECFAEKAREDATKAQVIVTNHALLAIDAIDGVPMLPEYGVVVVDEAHELTARVTQASTQELSPQSVERAARRARSHIDSREVDDLVDAADALSAALVTVPDGRIDVPTEQLLSAFVLIRDAARACQSAFSKGDKDKDTDTDAAKQQAKGFIDDVRKIADRMAANAETDVIWRADVRGNPEVRIAPIDVSLSLRDKLFGPNTVILTSATLKIGGTFEAIGRSLGLQPDDTAEQWDALDVGSPFDYAKQGMLYVAKHLPLPAREGLAEPQLAEITELIQAAGGRTLGLFSSRRADEYAAAEVSERLPDLDIWCQGDAQLPELARRFADDPKSCLFGTLSLWQGVDLPGEICQLVIIDRIPFPRPDDPLMSARQRLVEKHGGNGFMSVAASHAALLLAQGTGRLIRRTTDRGVVAILDPRLVTARYGSFLANSLPPMWRTTDKTVALNALKRLDELALSR